MGISDRDYMRRRPDDDDDDDQREHAYDRSSASGGKSADGLTGFLEKYPRAALIIAIVLAGLVLVAAIVSR